MTKQVAKSMSHTDVNGRLFDSWVLIEFATELNGNQYKNFVNDLMAKFITESDSTFTPEQARQLIARGQDWNNEGGIHGFQINGRYISSCKAFYFDESDFNMPQSILFCNHYSENSVKEVFELTGAFENFLKKEGIKYKRKNRYRRC